MLYLIEILHQTTTCSKLLWLFAGCILSKFYIKPQPYKNYYANKQGCILSKFYIKPQRLFLFLSTLPVVSYRNSTSNHNRRRPVPQHPALYLIEILHQTTTENCKTMHVILLYLIEILHQTTTGTRVRAPAVALYLIEILHQTTTGSNATLVEHELYLIEILHQTTTCG